MSQKFFDIDNMDGAGFENLCAHIYQQLGYKVRNVPHTGDKGRDLILKSPNGETIVGECKHWKNGTIGRPIVQKLHSAAITEGAQKALILTTGGHLSKGAVDYIKELAIPIEVIDMPKLKGLAARAGISLVIEQDDLRIICLPLSNSEDPVNGNIHSHLLSKYASYPISPETLFSVNQTSIEWTPVYLVRYSLKQKFKTSVGVIHRIKKSNGLIILNGENGKKLPQKLAEFINTSTLSDFEEDPKSTKSLPLKGFNVGDIDDIAKKRIVKRHTKWVDYRGGNNRTYSKKCIPNKRNVYLQDIRQVYVPIQKLNIRAMNHEYCLTLVDNGRDVCYIDNKDLFTCKMCNGIFRKGLLCNSCGAVAHDDWSCAFHCKGCNETICRRCAYWTRKLLIFKNYMCRGCGNRVDARKLD